ncbi:MAG: hypothetical protein EZS28_006331, partial [Streblomastix strix]
VAIP